MNIKEVELIKKALEIVDSLSRDTRSIKDLSNGYKSVEDLVRAAEVLCSDSMWDSKHLQEDVEKYQASGSRDFDRRVLSIIGMSRSGLPTGKADGFTLYPEDILGLVKDGQYSFTGICGALPRIEKPIVTELNFEIKGGQPAQGATGPC